MTARKNYITTASINDPTAEYPSEFPYNLTCRHCAGLGVEPKDDSKYCAKCNGTGDARHKQIGGVWFGGRELKKPTGSELRHLRRVNFWVGLFFVLCGSALIIYAYWFFTVGLRTGV
jgi:hypothetical protein